MKYHIRNMQPSEYSLLNDFLYDAIFLPPGVIPPPRSILLNDELQVYVKDFGKQKDDMALVAEVGRQVIGAVWARIMNDYGHMDNETPSLAISIRKEYRGKGIGTDLMENMLLQLRQRGYKRTSLAVQKANYAVHMYQKVGFVVVGETTEEYLMVHEL